MNTPNNQNLFNYLRENYDYFTHVDLGVEARERPVETAQRHQHILNDVVTLVQLLHRLSLRQLQ